MTTTQRPIIVPVDTLIHTDEHPYCSDVTCPCHDEVQDVLPDRLPSEAELDAQEMQTSGARSIDWSKIFE